MLPPTSSIQANLRWYIQHQDELVAKFNGRTIMIRDQAVAAVYDTFKQAVQDAKARGLLGKVSIREVAPGMDNYVVAIRALAA